MTTRAALGSAAAFALGLAAAVVGLQCSSPSPSSGDSPGGQPVGGSNHDAGAGPGGAVSDATVTGDDANPGGQNGDGSPDAASQGTEPENDGAAAGDGGATGTTDAGRSATWATWPMPNAPSSGLPHPQSYDTSTEGVAIDRVTGLTWQRDVGVLSTADSADAGPTLTDAAGYCAELHLGGFEDWRVPSRIELVSLLDFTRFPAIDTDVFTPTPSFLISSSVHGIDSANAIVGTVWTGDGTNTFGGNVSYLGIAAFLSEPVPADGSVPSIPLGPIQGPDAVRCVRGQTSASGPHYTIANGTVLDHWTGLTWIQSPSSSSMLPSDVPGYCTSQTLSGGGWRAPSANELETLWGDFYDPDAVTVDPTAFGGVDVTNSHIGTSNVDVGSSDGGPALWIYVINEASTGTQEDVYPSLFPPLPGGEPPMDYWANALCVRITSHVSLGLPARVLVRRIEPYR